MDLQVKDITGKIVGSVTADDNVWAVAANDALLHQAVVAQQANQRQGTHDTQNRSDVSYSTRKMRAQKHTGRARLGSRKSPAMVGGGVAHGPHPRSYNQKLPKKMRRLALKVALSDKVREEKLTVLDALSFDAPKTRSVRDLISALSLQGSTLIVTAEKDDIVVMSAANIQGVSVTPAAQLNPLQASAFANLVLTQDAVRAVDTLWGAAGSEG
jgi:large subunit ribosomal protein L4